MNARSSQERTVGRYVLCDEIAAGGMATVHLGRLLGAVGFARIVAIKRLHAHFAKDPEFVAMLLDEARLAARIQHPNVISTLDVVVAKGEVLVVMDYVQGESLARLARAAFGQGQRIPLGIVMAVISGALYGLHAAHNATDDQGQPLGIVHRDVSPQNILVGVDGIARVLDFGVAKAAGRAQTTREGALKGKLAYMSPEQIKAEPLDRRSDIYAASVVLWELVCGKRLHKNDNEAATILKIISGKVPAPREVVRDLPPEVDALVMRGLSHDPAQRFQSAWEMAEAAQRIAFATPGDVAAWVAHFGGTSIAERAARVAEIESQPSYPQADDAATTTYERPTAQSSAKLASSLAREAGLTRVQPVRAPIGPAHSQVTDFSAATPFTKTSAVTPPLIVAIALGIALVGVGVGVGVFATRSPRSSSPAASATVSQTSPVVTAAPPAASATSEPIATPTPSASATAKPSPPRPPIPTAHAKCNPPYTIDANGIRVPKPECM